MERIEILEEKIRAAVSAIDSLRLKNGKLAEDYKRLEGENELLQSENRQVRRLLAELDRLREERKTVKQKCEKLLLRFHKLKI